MSVNRHATKYADGSDIETFRDEGNYIKFESSKEAKATLEKGLSRKGYKLAGFNRLGEDGIVSINPSTVQYKATDVVNSSTGAITIPLTQDDEGKNTNLYAIWERDTDSPYFNKTATPLFISISASDINSANPSAPSVAEGTLEYKNYKNLSNLTDVNDQEFKFIALPGGRIGGTDDNPEYFKWPGSWIEITRDPSDNQVVSITDDFAIADITITSGLWNVVYAWATSDERGDEKYNFDLGKTYELMAGMYIQFETTSGGTVGVTNSYSRNSAVNPLVGVSYYQAIVFCNALTEWYNNVKLGDTQQDKWLTVAYTDDGTANGNVIRDADRGDISASTPDMTKVINKINTKESPTFNSSTDIPRVPGSTGFRLPSRAEYLYAAGVLPDGVPSSWDSPYTKDGKSTFTSGAVSYPQSQHFSFPSGIDHDATISISQSDTALLKKINPYVINFVTYFETKNNEKGTKAVGKYFQKDSVRDEAKPNQLGLYEMSGNADQLLENRITSSGTLYTVGGNFGWAFGTNSVFSIGANKSYNQGYKNDNHSNVSTIRLCVTLSQSTN